jgi:hypothetical protein
MRRGHVPTRRSLVMVATMGNDDRRTPSETPTPDDGINPAIKRALGEAAVHDAEALRRIKDVRDGKTPRPMPAYEPGKTGFEDITEEITGINGKLDAMARAKSESGRSPQLSLSGPFGITLTARSRTSVIVAVLAMLLATIVALAWLAKGRPVPPPAAPSVVLVPAHS